MAISHVASQRAELACVGNRGLMNGPSVTSDALRALKRSMLRIPVIVDQPEISRALDIKNWAMFIAPYGSNGAIEVWSFSEERKSRTASEYCMDGPEFSERSRRCAQSAEEEAFHWASGHGRSCLISRWDIERGIERIWYQRASIWWTAKRVRLWDSARMNCRHSESRSCVVADLISRGCIKPTDLASEIVFVCMSSP